MIHTEERDWLGNAALFLVSIMGFVFVPTLVAKSFNILFKGLLDVSALSILGDCAFVLLMLVFYYKDLKREAKKFTDTFKSSMSKGLWYYFIGLLVMIISNVIISFVIKEVSANESAVRDLLYDSPLLTMINIAIFAPLTEELLFRKSLRPLIKNKWIYALVSGLLFGGAHLVAGLSNFQIIDLLYLIPYGSLGFVFALGDAETESTFTSITIHGLHNFVTGMLLLILYFSGAM